MTARPGSPPPPAARPSSVLHDLKALVQSMQPVVAIETVEEERVDGLLQALAAELRLPLFTWTATQGLRRFDGQGTVHGTADPKLLLRHLASLTVQGIFHLKDVTPHITDPVVVRAFREAAHACVRTRATIVVSGASIALPEELARETVPMRLQLPGREDLRDLVASVVTSLREQRGLRVTLEPDDLEPLLAALSGLTLNQARQAVTWAALRDGVLGGHDIPELLKRKSEAINDGGGLLELFTPGENTFELGGFARLKAWLDRARVGFGAEAAALGLPAPRGVLLVGVQGCGKSLAAKVIARVWQQPLLKLDAGRLYDKYIGETEKNLRKALDIAEALAPSVLWIDEIEKAFASGGEADGGVSRRLLGSFLTWMQERQAQVFVAATANDISSLPPELLRKGRFDEIFFVGLPAPPERQAILRIHLGLRRQDAAAFDIEALTARTDGFSGAELEQIVVSGLYRALHQREPLTTALLLEEAAQVVPLSVSRRDEVDRLVADAHSRFTPVA